MYEKIHNYRTREKNKIRIISFFLISQKFNLLYISFQDPRHIEIVNEFHSVFNFAK
jgi:hypothetical protein